MKGFLQVETQELEDFFEAKLMELRGPDQEESKELGLIAKRIKELQECLEINCNRVIQTVRESAAKAVNPLSAYSNQIDSIKDKFQEFKTHWKQKEEDPVLQDKLEGLQMLKTIKEMIVKLQPATNSDKSQQLIQFDSDAIFKALISNIGIRGSNIAQFQPEQQHLITPRGFYELESGKFTDFELQRQLPQNYACFQKKNQLYICGGSAKTSGKKEYKSDLFSFNISQKVSPLASMKYPRQDLSLCGNNGSLLSLGGWKGETLQAVEVYFLQFNKWGLIAPLKIARICPGSCLLQNKSAFCFCGYRDGNMTNSIETINLAQDEKWKFLPFNGQVVKNYHLAVAVIKNKLIVFGGVQRASFTLQQFKKDGALEIEGSANPIIPGNMCFKAFIVRQDCIYAEGRNEEGERALTLYDGFQWTQK